MRIYTAKKKKENVTIQYFSNRKTIFFIIVTIKVNLGNHREPGIQFLDIFQIKKFIRQPCHHFQHSHNEIIKTLFYKTELGLIKAQFHVFSALHIL